ncbi:uncharacterized protein KY384_003434 [Bacidia gigantensis]|uniref:uncharacterized protein n=1 Tax=Bacidia gigantensis TaxID=2732470 RepID=UPI001D052842|nr:uncharacterized protein KY384_003434 [Bacidia gigantensis]KAG8531798.1 hypothetical protein KY384_003434 [Bacidia gigantensis]
MPGGSRRRKQREREAQEKRSDEEKTVMPQLRSSNMTTRSMTSNAVSSATGPDLSHVTPDALLSHTPVYSKIRHQENLLFLFTQRAKDGAVRKMHQTWMECRSRCVEALRSNRPAVINAKSGSKSEIEHTLAEFEKFLKFVGPDKNLNLYKFVKEVVFDNIMLLHLEADRSGYLNEVRKPHRSHFQVFEQLAAMPKNSGKPK